MPNAEPLPAPHFLYGTAWKEDRTTTLTELALRSGFRGIDTANQRKHYFEEGVGKALANAFQSALVKREDIFVQTKFTYPGGQDHRLPYDRSAPLAKQVAQSLASSLEHLRIDYVDSYLLHGPSSAYGWTSSDAEVWEAMVEESARGRARTIGVSNVSLAHLEQMTAFHKVRPRFVQNRCFATQGWDRAIRQFCRENGIVYQGFSLLTANVGALRHPTVTTIANDLRATSAQVIFCFARQIGMLPLTGTSDPDHMKQDLLSLSLTLPDAALRLIESLAV